MIQHAKTYNSNSKSTGLQDVLADKMKMIVEVHKLDDLL